MSWLGKRIVAGFVLLLPVILSYLLLGALFDMLVGLTSPIADFLPGSLFSDEWEQRITAGIVLAALCLAIGLADETRAFKRFGSWVERQFLERFAPYSVLKSFSSHLSANDVPDKLHPALVHVGNGVRQLAFVVEEHGDTDVTVFVPMASTPAIGHVQIVPAASVEKLGVTVMEALGPQFNWGDGTKALVNR